MTAGLEWELLAFGLMTGAMTFIGGRIALRFSGPPNLLLGLSSGAIIGVALFDLLPEAMRLAGTGYETFRIRAALAAGFAFYLAVDCSSAVLGQRRIARTVAPAALVFHSFLDGVGIGFAFHVSWAAGVVVAIGVLVHDLVDGANTISVALAGGATSSTAGRWLVADTFAPIFGILLASATSVSARPLAVVLGLCGGAFLYVGVGVLLPRLYADFSRLTTLISTAFGLCFIYVVIRLSRGS